MTAATISSFLERVRARLNRGVAWRVGAWALLVMAGVCVLWAIGWRLNGYAAPRAGYAVIALVAVVATGVVIFKSRRRIPDAARSADEVFRLKDGLISWLDFRIRGEDREAFQLHEKSLGAKISTLDAEALPIEKPKRKLAIGLGLSAVAIGLAFLPHSESVRKRIALEALTSERSAAISKEMQEAVEELIKQLSAEERDLLDEKKLREWSKEIEQTKDAREAEKQLAKIE